MFIVCLDYLHATFTLTYPAGGETRCRVQAVEGQRCCSVLTSAVSTYTGVPCRCSGSGTCVLRYPAMMHGNKFGG